MKKGLVAIMIMACLALGALTVVLRISEDKTAPEIHFQDNGITYTEGEGYDQLLEGVTATDNRDGDVTQSLVVERVYPNEDRTTATIVYVARDKSNNIGKANKVVNFRNNGNPVQETAAEPDQPSEDTSDIQPDTGADAGETPTTETSTAETGIPGGQEDMPEDGDVLNLPEGSPVIKLKEEQVTIQRGESINRIALVESITDDKDEKNALWNRISIDGEFDANTPGTYEQIYYVMDSDGNKSNEAKLTITVR